MSIIYCSQNTLRRITNSATQTKASVTSVEEAIADLSLSVTSGIPYAFRAFLMLNCNGAGGFKIGTVGPTMNYLSWNGIIRLEGAFVAGLGLSSAFGGATNGQPVQMEGSFKPSVGGNFGISFAAAANGVVLTVNLGSWLEVWPLL